jgi:hypothetical protein
MAEDRESQLSDRRTSTGTYIVTRQGRVHWQDWLAPENWEQGTYVGEFQEAAPESEPVLQ